MVNQIIKVLLLFFLIPQGLQAGANPDSIIIRNFKAEQYKASPTTYHGIELANKVTLFANENGVLQYDGSEWKIISLKNFSPAISLLEDGNRIYVGGRNEIGYLEPNEMGELEYTSLKPLLDPEGNISLSDTWQIIKTEEGIYFETYEMILRYDGNSMHIIPLQSAYIFKVNRQLFASVEKKGLAKIEKDTVTFVNTAFAFDKDMAFIYIKGLKGENLILTADNGIYTFDPVKFTTKKWEGAANSLLQKNSLYSMLTWNDSIYVCATFMGGIFLLDREGKLIKAYNKDNGLTSDFLREIFEDSRGNIWITSDYGLNYLQFAGQGAPAIEPEPVIRYLTINDQQTGLAPGQDSFETEKDYAGSTIFHFATPGFHKEELEYSFKLEGYDRKWSDWKQITSKEYTNLRQGNYTFRLKARIPGKKESRPVRFFITIPISWYKTNLAYFCFALLLPAGIYAAIHYRTKRLKHSNMRLAKIIKSRTAEIMAQKEQLRVANNDLKIKNKELDNFVYRSSHDLVAPLKSLKGLISIAQLENEKKNLPTYFKLMNSSIDKLENFIKSIMEYSSNSKKAVTREEVDLNEIIDSINEDLKYYEKTERIEFIRNISAPSFLSDAKRLRIILSNLITNSIKYHNYNQDYLFTEVRSAVEKDKIKIEVIDNGKGIANEYLDKIFDMFFRASDGADGSGLGLYIVKDTVNNLGGQISVRSESGKGTAFTLYFPLSGVVEDTPGSKKRALRISDL